MRSVLGCLGVVAATAMLGAPSAGAAPSTTGEFTKVEATGPRPSERSTPAVGAIGSDVYVFGGAKDDFQTKVNTFYNDLYRFDTVESTWERLEPDGELPPERAFAAGVGDEARRRIYVFGGAHYGPMFVNFVAYDDLWAYAPDTNAWTELEAANAGPEGRSRPNMWLVGDVLYVFGGVTATFETLNDLWAFDLTANTWALLHDGEADAPPTRHEAQAGTYARAGKLTLYGGERVELLQGEFFSTLEDTWELDVATRTWRDVTPAAPNDLEPPRNYGSAAMVGDSVYLHGGDVPGGSSGCGAPFPQNPTDEVWRLDLASNQWNKVALSGTPTKLKRTNAAAVAGVMYIFSGYEFKCDAPTDPGQVWNTEVYAFRPSAVHATGLREQVSEPAGKPPAGRAAPASTERLAATGARAVPGVAVLLVLIAALGARVLAGYARAGSE